MSIQSVGSCSCCFCLEWLYLFFYLSLESFYVKCVFGIDDEVYHFTVAHNRAAKEVEQPTRRTIRSKCPIRMVGLVKKMGVICSSSAKNQIQKPSNWNDNHRVIGLKQRKHRWFGFVAKCCHCQWHDSNTKKKIIFFFSFRFMEFIKLSC